MAFNLIASADSNVKLAKLPNVETLESFRVFGLTLAPHTSSGFNVCSMATNCTKLCVLETGRGQMPNVKDARIRKTRLLFENPSEFHRLLNLDFQTVARQSEREGFTPLFRLDVASDLGWFRYARDYPSFRFYGYTKVHSRFRKPIPSNMHLTYSWNELSVSRGVNPQTIFQAGHNIAVVVDTVYGRGKRESDPLPETFTLEGVTSRMVDGDVHDWRIPETDGIGNFIGLRFKGSKAKKQDAIASGFCLTV